MSVSRHPALDGVDDLLSRAYDKVIDSGLALYRDLLDAARIPYEPAEALERLIVRRDASRRPIFGGEFLDRLDVVKLYNADRDACREAETREERLC